MQAAGVLDNRSRINLVFGALISAGIAGCASLMLSANAYAESTHPLRIALLLLLLISVHLLFIPRLWVSRELKLYGAFVGFMLLSMLWTADLQTALDQISSAINCGLVFILFSALVAYHNRRAVFTGMLGGLVVAAGTYSMTKHFPLEYPEGFSYNTMAGMYLFGLFATIIYGWFSRRTILPLALGIVFLLLVAATTSIKTNVGIALGAAVSGMFYFRHFIKAIRKTLLLFIVFGALVAVGINSNEALTDRVSIGMERVSKGVQILVAREDDFGTTELGARERWKDYGLKGWLQNPVFGYGIEGFRADFGTTSHSTPIDLLYNSGIIGFGLFYGILMSICSRLYRADDPGAATLRPILFGFLICYAFMSLSGILYNDAFLAIYMATSAALLGTRSPREGSADNV
jgi:hypothetical protein